MQYPEATPKCWKSATKPSDSPPPTWTPGALEPSQGADALHVALASLARVDVLASWNFRHMVSLWRIRAYNDVNGRLGCPALDIRTPKELNDAA